MDQTCLFYSLKPPTIVSFVYASLDLYGIVLYKLLGAHLDIVADLLAAIGHGRQSGHRLANAPLAWQRCNEQQLYACLRYHMLCLEFAQCLNEVLSLQYFLQFGMSVTVVCCSLFKLITLDPFEQTVKFMSVLMYVLGLVFQIFLPCYLGSVVKAKSDRLLRAIYASNWIDQSAEYKFAVLMFGERSKRVIAPKACLVFALELPMFLSVGEIGHRIHSASK